jgi:molybdopterin converting factor small subunit
VAAPVRILLFASAREAVGRSSLERAAPGSGGTVSDVLSELVREYPGLRPILAASRIVLNGEYLTERVERVRSGDEIAIHPPYSGG